MVSMREPRGSHGPGTFWLYNNWDFNALGTIYEQETGEDLAPVPRGGADVVDG